MKRDPFDLVCSCDHETKTHHCICTRRMAFAGGRCSSCKDGKHILHETGKAYAPEQALTALKRMTPD